MQKEMAVTHYLLRITVSESGNASSDDREDVLACVEEALQQEIFQRSLEEETDGKHSDETWNTDAGVGRKTRTGKFNRGWKQRRDSC